MHQDVGYIAIAFVSHCFPLPLLQRSRDKNFRTRRDNGRFGRIKKRHGAMPCLENTPFLLLLQFLLPEKSARSAWGLMRMSRQMTSPAAAKAVATA